MSRLIYFELSEKVLDAAFAVHRLVGPGLLEKVYEKALCIEFTLQNVDLQKQKEFTVLYKGNVVGSYICDLFIENKIILELKSVSEITKNMEAQLLNYLRVSKFKVGYIINFRNKRLEWKRMALEQD